MAAKHRTAGGTCSLTGIRVTAKPNVSKLFMELVGEVESHSIEAEDFNDPRFLLALFDCPKAREIRQKLTKAIGD